MPVAGDYPLVGGEVGGAHGASGVEFVGAYADLGAQAVLAAVGEAGAGVYEDVGDELFDAVGGAVDVNVAVAGEVLEDGDGGIGDDGADEGFAASGNDEVYVFVQF